MGTLVGQVHVAVVIMAGERVTLPGQWRIPSAQQPRSRRPYQVLDFETSSSEARRCADGLPESRGLGAIPPGTGATPRPARSQQQLKERLIFFGPAGFLLFLLVIFPTFYNFYLSFRGSAVDGLAGVFPTLANYVQMPGDARLLNSIVVTVVFLVLATAVQLFLGFTGAIAIDDALTEHLRWLRSFYVLPMMIPPVVVGTVWRLLYEPSSGFVNYFVKLLGLAPQQWLGAPNRALFALVAVDTWQWTPFLILIILAALSAVPKEEVEAAQIDGANGFQTLFHIKLPYLHLAIMIGVLFRIIELFKLFDIVLVLSQGGPGTVTETISYYLYQNAFRFNKPEYAAAMALVLLMIVSFLAQMYFKLLAREGRYLE
jgi:multiple sugar transport system permease protein